MIWQDWIIGLINIGLAYNMVLPMINGFKEKRGNIDFQTGLITFPLLFILAFMFFTLELYFSTVIAILTGILWLALFLQTAMYGKKKKSPPVVPPQSQTKEMMPPSALPPRQNFGAKPMVKPMALKRPI